jgi:tetratricopeptide (TPR) repeat protein
MDYRRASESQTFPPEAEAKLRQTHVDSAARCLMELKNARTPKERFYSLGDAARAAYCLEQYAVAEEFATELLSIAESYRESWAYGNAVHEAHTALGLVELNRGDRKAAIEHLLASGATEGSPQLNSFGPTMELARQLMKVGEFDAASQCLALCTKFWSLGSAWLEIWSEMIALRRVPNCFWHRWR